MAKKLSTLVARDDHNGREVKCLIVENQQTGAVTKFYDHKQFASVIEAFSPDEVVRVYSPTEDERINLFKFINDNSVEAEDGTTKVDISDEDLFCTMFQHFTDMDVEDVLQDKALLRKVLDNPSELFLSVKATLDQLLLSVIASYREMVETIASTPQDLLEAMLEKNNIEEELEKQKEIEQLQQRIKELQG